jgi:predicted thioesterase
MKQSLSQGISNVKRFSVDRDRTITFMGEEGRVYATPSLVRDMEHTCRDLLMEHADDGEDSVGVEITVRHLAATLPDMEVEITATVKALDGRRVTFELEAKDEMEQIGAGSHTRFVVDVAKTFERLKAKAAKRAARSK